MDLQRNQYLKIPNLLCEILNTNQRILSVEEIKDSYNNQLDKGIDKYIKFLVEEEYGFITAEPENFPKMSLLYVKPRVIDRAIIEVSKHSSYCLNEVFNQLEESGCQSIQLRFFDCNLSKEHFVALGNLSHSSFKLVEIFLPSSSFDTKIEHLFYDNLRYRIILYSCSNKPAISSIHKSRLIGTPKHLFEIDFDSYILSNLNCSTWFYIEAVNRNTGINGLVCIDSFGNIKNYLTHAQSFGNLAYHSLTNIIQGGEFKAKGMISNDLIEVCSDCQFRYMCQSNSDIFLNENHVYVKTDYCDYEL